VHANNYPFPLLALYQSVFEVIDLLKPAQAIYASSSIIDISM
jgi:hypothetical protein